MPEPTTRDGQPLDFDPFDADIRNCWCELCMALASAVQRGGYSWPEPQARLYAALVDGTHVHRGPPVSLAKKHDWPSARLTREGFSFMQYGTGIGVTTGGVGGARKLPGARRSPDQKEDTLTTGDVGVAKERFTQGVLL